MIDHQQALALIALGIGGGMVYGRWRDNRIRARIAAKRTWDNKHNNNNPPSMRPW